MTDDRSLERAARSWLETGPTEAPDHAVYAALLRIQTTPQERDWHVPRRPRPMTMTSRLLAGAAALAVVLVGGMLILRAGPSATVGASPPPGPSPSPPPSATAVIPDGRYLGPTQLVSAILAALAADKTLSDTEKAAIVTSVLGVDGKTSFQVAIEIRGNEFISSQCADAEPFAAETPWPLSSIDDKTIILRLPCCGLQGYEVHRTGSGFTLKTLSPASSPVEAFVRHVTFETGTFTPAP